MAEALADPATDERTDAEGTGDPALNGAGGHPDGPPDDAPETPELLIDGTGQLSFTVGGKRPSGSSIRIVGGKVALEGQFAKGERIGLYVEVEVGEVSFVDERDAKTGQVVGCDRRHKARIAHVRRAQPEG